MSLILRISLAIFACALGSSVIAQAGDGWASSSQPNLEHAAEEGIKPAQLELGRRYEEGILVEKNLKSALKWYGRAGNDVRRNEYIYSPPVGDEKYGRVITERSYSIIPGLIEARSRADKIKHILKIME